MVLSPKKELIVRVKSKRSSNTNLAICIWI